MGEPFFRPDELMRTLERHGVQYVVIGGLAATLRGSPYPTADLDITPSADRDNLDRLAAALRELEAKLRVPGTDELVEWPLDARSLDQGTTWTFVTSAGYLDVCLRPDGTTGFSDVARDATREEVADELTVLVASLADVIRSKEAANRDKDQRMLPGLRLLEEEIARSSTVKESKT